MHRAGVAKECDLRGVRGFTPPKKEVVPGETTRASCLYRCRNRCTKRRLNSALRPIGSVATSPPQRWAACASQPNGQRVKRCSPQAGQSMLSPVGRPVDCLCGALDAGARAERTWMDDRLRIDLDAWRDPAQHVEQLESGQHPELVGIRNVIVGPSCIKVGSHLLQDHVELRCGGSREATDSGRIHRLLGCSARLSYGSRASRCIDRDATGGQRQKIADPGQIPGGLVRESSHAACVAKCRVARSARRRKRKLA